MTITAIRLNNACMTCPYYGDPLDSIAELIHCKGSEVESGIQNPSLDPLGQGNGTFGDVTSLQRLIQFWGLNCQQI